MTSKNETNTSGTFLPASRSQIPPMKSSERLSSNNATISHSIHVSDRPTKHDSLDCEFILQRHPQSVQSKPLTTSQITEIHTYGYDQNRCRLCACHTVHSSSRATSKHKITKTQLIPFPTRGHTSEMPTDQEKLGTTEAMHEEQKDHLWSLIPHIHTRVVCRQMSIVPRLRIWTMVTVCRQDHPLLANHHTLHASYLS